MTVVASKTKLISNQTALAADTSETTLGDAGTFDARGWVNPTFSYYCSAITGGVADTNYFQLVILGAGTKTDTKVPINGLSSGQIIAVGGGTIPTAANAPGVVLPRYIQVKWDETGTVTGFAAKAWVHYTRPVIGPGVDHGNKTG